MLLMSRPSSFRSKRRRSFSSRAVRWTARSATFAASCRGTITTPSSSATITSPAFTFTPRTPPAGRLHRALGRDGARPHGELHLGERAHVAVPGIDDEALHGRATPIARHTQARASTAQVVDAVLICFAIRDSPLLARDLRVLDDLAPL